MNVRRILAVAVLLPISCVAHGDHSDPLKGFGLKKQFMHDHRQVEEHREAAKHHGGGSPMTCPFLKAIVPDVEHVAVKAKWMVSMLVKNSAFVAQRFAENASLTVHGSGGEHDKAVGPMVYTGHAAIEKAMNDTFGDINEVRLRGLYPDHPRGMMMANLEVFAKCPHSDQLFSADWAMEVHHKKHNHSHGHHHGGLQMLQKLSNKLSGHGGKDHGGGLIGANIWKGQWRGSGGSGKQAAPAAPPSFANRVSAAMGQVASMNNCTEFLSLLEADAKLDIADMFYHKNKAFEMNSDVTSLVGAAAIKDYCETWLAHKKRITPIQFVKVAETLDGDQKSFVMFGSVENRVVFSPEIKDWAGAVRVIASDSGKVAEIKIYPTEALALAAKWSWKYGDGSVMTTVQLMALKTVAFSSEHKPLAAGIAISFVMLQFLFVFRCFFTCLRRCFSRIFCCCRCQKMQVCVREIEQPMMPMGELA